MDAPDPWSGDGSDFTTLRFMLESLSAKRAVLPPVVTILGFNGITLAVSPPPPDGTWSPYTIELTVQTFGVTQGQFDAVIGNVAHATIVGDLVNADDTAVRDDVSLSTASAPAGAPPDRRSIFEAGVEVWRKGGFTGSRWGLLAVLPEHLPAGGHPGGNIGAADDFTSLTGPTSPAWPRVSASACLVSIVNGSRFPNGTTAACSKSFAATAASSAGIKPGSPASWPSRRSPRPTPHRHDDAAAPGDSAPIPVGLT